jgi:hypothetical protein
MLTEEPEDVLISIVGRRLAKCLYVFEEAFDDFRERKPFFFLGASEFQSGLLGF